MSTNIKHHPSYEQVMLDVNRCAGRLELMRRVYFHRTDEDYQERPQYVEQSTEGDNDNTSNDLDDDSNGSNKAASRNKEKEEDSHDHRELKRNLANLIVKLLIENPGLHYYQGFHDVCLTCMTLLGEKEAFNKLNQLMSTHFNLFMQPTMNETQEFLALIPIIIGLCSSKMQEFLERAEIGTIFALSWVITWFSHVIPNEIDVETIFKFLEEQDPHMVLYLCAEIVMLKQDKILELEAEMSTVHHFLCQIPRREKLPIERLIDKSIQAHHKWPPEFLKQRLDNQRKAKLQLHDYNILRSLATRFVPALTNVVGTSNAKTAIIVLTFASVVAIYGFDRWIK